MSSSSPNCFSKLLSSLSVFSFLPLGRMVSNVKSSSGCEVTRDNFISCIVFSSFSSLARTEKFRQLYPLESMQAILGGASPCKQSPKGEKEVHLFMGIVPRLKRVSNLHLGFPDYGMTNASNFSWVLPLPATPKW